MLVKLDEYNSIAMLSSGATLQSPTVARQLDERDAGSWGHVESEVRG